MFGIRSSLDDPRLAGPHAEVGLGTLARKPKSFLVTISALSVLALGVIDYLTGPQLAFSIFYLLPIALLTWLGGRTYGYGLSLFSAAVWLAADLAGEQNYAHLVIPYWNAFAHLGMFTLVTYLLSYLKAYQELESTHREELRVKEAVRRSEERYRGLVENMNEGYFVLDPDGKFMYCSPNIYARTGFTEQELLGRSSARLIERGDRRKVVSFFLSRAADGTVDATYEFRVRMRDGRSLWVEQSTRIMRGRDGEVVEYRNVIRDISERKLAGMRLSEQMTLHNTLLRAQSDLGLGVAMTEGLRFTYVNDALCRMYGYTAEELLQMSSFLELILPAERPVLESRLAGRAANADVPSHGETTVIHKDGRLVRIEYAMKPISYDGPPRMYSTIRDITATKRAEEQIRLLARSVESTSEMISITDLDNRFIFVNKAFLDAYGYREDEILGNNPSVLLPGEDVEATMKEVFQKTLLHRYTGELLNRRKDGTVFPVHLSTSQIRDQSGKLVGLIGVARDITTMRLAEDALMTAEARFESLFDEMKPRQSAAVQKRAHDPSDLVIDDLTKRINTFAERMSERIRHVLSFSSFASHELRTPLAVVRSQLEDGLDVSVSAKRLRNIVASAYDETLRLSRTVDMLLDIATMLSGRLKLNTRPVDFRKFVRDFCGDAVILCRKKNVSVTVSAEAKAMVSVDEDRMKEVLYNLFDNALKHSKENGSIRLSTNAAGKMIVFQIADTGEGIAPADLPHIFDPFFQAKGKTAESYRGSGLGLTLVKAIVEAHGGSITAESEPDKGTIFTVQLPTGS